MSQSLQPNIAAHPQSWHYPVEDFLEIACGLPAQERSWVMSELKKAVLAESRADCLPAVLLGNKVLLVSGHQHAEEVWVFDTLEKKLRKIQLSEAQLFSKPPRQ